MPEHGSKTSTVPVVWANFGIFFGTIQIISCRNWWIWTKPGHITMTRIQSNNQWSGGIAAHPAPKNSECKNSLEKFSTRFFGIKTASFSLSSKGPNYQRGVLFISAGAIEEHFEEKMPPEVHQGVLFLHNNAPVHWALATQKKLAYLGFQCLDHPPYSPDLARQSTTCSLDWKNNWKVAIFRLTRRSLLPPRPGWTDKLLNFFFWVACKS